MSIEEARAAVLERLRASDYADWSRGWPGSPYGDLKDEPLLDLLLTQVKASMPCYHAYCCYDDCDHWSACPQVDAEYICPSCSAREQLNVPA